MTDIRAFMEQAVTGLARDGKARIARLIAAGRPIAALVTLQSGTTAWCWKIAYDESFARYSPGVQLLLETTQELLDDPNITRADSCATADHPMIDHVWRERLALADHLMQRWTAAAGRLRARRRARAGAPRRDRGRQAPARSRVTPTIGLPKGYHYLRSAMISRCLHGRGAML